ncbi:GNAT family N-acetyltransferase [Corynebacterium urogenitale]
MQHEVILSCGPVTLRPLEVADAPQFFDLVEAEAWQGMATPVPESVDDVEQQLHSMIETPDTQAWAVLYNDEFVGRTALYGIVEGLRTEVGSTYYGQQARGTVVNPTAKYLLLKHCFEERGFHRVALRCDSRNSRSHRAIAALGATFEGTLRNYRRGADGSVVNLDYFSITPEEWPQVGARLKTRLG